MKRIEAARILIDTIAQTMGDDFQPLIDPTTQQPISNEAFAALDSQALADIGQAVTGETTITNLVNGLISRLGKHEIEARGLDDFLPSIDVDPQEWGGFMERTRIGLGEILNDPMFSKTAGQSYAELEHTYFGQDVQSRIFEEGKPIMCPISIEREMLKDAFLSWDKMDEYISAKQTKIQATLTLALMALKRGLVNCAIARSDISGTAVHLITDAVADGVLEQIPVEGNDPRNPTLKEAIQNPLWIAYCLERMADVMGYMRDPSVAFNDGSMPTWANERPRLILLQKFVNRAKFGVKANTFNPDQIGIGSYDTINSWQAIDDPDTSGGSPVHAYYDLDTLSSISIAANEAAKIGTSSAYSQSGIIGLAFDRKALGLGLMRNKVTSSYTGSADFWNMWHHALYNAVFDPSYAMVAFIAD
jgi:hypothetical protein